MFMILSKRQSVFIKTKNTQSEITVLFSGILVMGNGLANMTIFGLLENPMIHTDIWRSPLSVSISL